MSIKAAPTRHRETAPRMWTENVTRFSNEEGKKGRIQIGQLANLIVPDHDFLSGTEDEIADIRADLKNVGGKVVYGVGNFSEFDYTPLQPAMPDWSPVRSFGGYAAWGEPEGAGEAALQRKLAMSCGCTNNCNVHGHAHATAWSSKLPFAHLKNFWGAFGCARWAV